MALIENTSSESVASLQIVIPAFFHQRDWLGILWHRSGLFFGLFISFLRLLLACVVQLWCWLLWLRDVEAWLVAVASEGEVWRGVSVCVLMVS